MGGPKRDSDIVSRLRKLFAGKKCKFKQKAVHIMAACNLSGYGVSYDGMMMIMGGTVGGIVADIGIKDIITNKMIANALPSQDTLGNWEIDLAVDARIKDGQEAVDDGATDFGGQTNHGNKKVLKY